MNLDELERLATAAETDPGMLSGVNVIGGDPRHLRAFVAASKPHIVLAVLTELREARATIARLTEERDTALLRGVRAGLGAAAKEILRDQRAAGAVLRCVASEVVSLDPHAIAAEAAREKP